MFWHFLTIELIPSQIHTFHGYVYNNQLDALFTLGLLSYHTSTCFGRINSPSSGGGMYICCKWCLLYFWVDCQRAWMEWNWCVGGSSRLHGNTHFQHNSRNTSTTLFKHTNVGIAFKNLQGSWRLEMGDPMETTASSYASVPFHPGPLTVNSEV
jgi:hypothetical protein